MDKLYIVEGAKEDIYVQQDNDYCYPNQYYVNDGEPEYEVIPFQTLSNDELEKQTYIDYYYDDDTDTDTDGTDEVQQEGIHTCTEPSVRSYDFIPDPTFDSSYLPFILWDFILDIMFEYCIMDLYYYLLMDT